MAGGPGPALRGVRPSRRPSSTTPGTVTGCRWSTGTCGNCPRGRRPGGTCRNGTGHRKRSTNGCGDGRRTAPGAGRQLISSSIRTPSAGSAGRSAASIPPGYGPINTLRGPKRGLWGLWTGEVFGRSRGGLSRPVPWRAEYEDPPGLRRTQPATGLHRHQWERQLLHPARAGNGQHQSGPVRTGQTTDQTGAGGGRQGLLVPEDLRLRPPAPIGAAMSSNWARPSMRATVGTVTRSECRAPGSATCEPAFNKACHRIPRDAHQPQRTLLYFAKNVPLASRS